MVWHRSSFSTLDTCVEVDFTKSSHSVDGNCVEVAFTKSTYSAMTECVEVGHAAGHVHVRHSRAPGGPVLCFTPAEWAAFCAGVRNDEFDL